VFVELVAPDDVLRRRLDARNGANAAASDARAEDFDVLSARYEPPDALEDARHIRVESTSDPVATTTEILRSLLRLAL
jgi:hypothetical protein